MHQYKAGHLRVRGIDYLCIDEKTQRTEEKQSKNKLYWRMICVVSLSWIQQLAAHGAENKKLLIIHSCAFYTSKCWNLKHSLTNVCLSTAAENFNIHKIIHSSLICKLKIETRYLNNTRSKHKKYTSQMPVRSIIPHLPEAIY